MLDTYEQNSKKKLIATVLTIVVIAGAVVLVDMLKTDDTTVTTTPGATTATSAYDAATTSNQASTSTASTSTSTSSGSVKDGTYSATSDYYVPHGTESIKVSLTLTGGTITDVSIVNSEGDRDSIAYQEDFSASYKSHVVGKKISGLQLSNVAGASDTTQGFNEALNQIASQAQA